MFAEAQNVLTGLDAVSPIAGMSPRQALEKVRERAFGTGAPEITQYDADFFTAIVNERAWEFGCESIRRRFDTLGIVGGENRRDENRSLYVV